MDWPGLLHTIQQFLIDWGYWGIILAGFLSGTIIPLSSEAVLVVLLSQGLDPGKLFLLATVSNWIGGMTTFWIGHLGKLEWIEKYFRVTHKQLLRWESKVAKYGAYFAILGWLPLLGNAIVLALGYFRAREWPSTWWLLVGKTIRYAIIIWLMN